MKSDSQQEVVTLIQSRRYAVALDALQHHLALDPEDWWANCMAGVSLRFLGEYGLAVTHLLKANELHPDDATVLLALGISLQMSGNLSGAVQVLRKSLECDPNLIEAFNSLGLTYKKMGEFNTALTVYEAGIERLMDLISAEVHKNPTLCYRDELEDGKSVRYVLPYVLSRTRELIRSNLVYASLQNNAGVCFSELGDIEAARASFLEAIDCTPDGYEYPEPSHNLANLGFDL